MTTTVKVKMLVEMSIPMHTILSMHNMMFKQWSCHPVYTSITTDHLIVQCSPGGRRSGYCKIPF